MDSLKPARPALGKTYASSHITGLAPTTLSSGAALFIAENIVLQFKLGTWEGGRRDVGQK